MNEQLTERLSRMVEYCLPDNWTSVAYALTVGGELVAADELGHRGGRERARADGTCTYNIGSVSKLYCTAAVLRLCERGKLSLDEPVCTYLPRFRMPDERYRQITLRHCLNHASGLPGTLWRNFCVSDFAAAEDYYDIVYDYCEKNMLKAAPGTYSVYCNDGFTLAEMAVAAAAGEPYADYLRRNITEPLGAVSTRACDDLHPDRTLVRDRSKSPELLCIPGAGGLTTTMPDLCAFGRVFLGDNPVLSAESVREMTRPQGVTFLKGDKKTADYGLGWDTVAYSHPDYALGAGGLRKGGDTFQFTTQFFVLPAFDAVFALSATHDCALAEIGLSLRMLAVALLDRGINITRAWKPVPEKLRAYAGVYLRPGAALDLRIDGPFAELISNDSRGHRERAFGTMCWDGKKLTNADGQCLSFEEQGGDVFLLLEDHGPAAPFAQKAQPRGKLPVAWKKRIGKGYLPVNAQACDLVIGEAFSSMRLRRLKCCEGVMLACFPMCDDLGGVGMFECPFAAIDNRMGTSFLRTPGNPSRDAVTPIFFTENGVEYCDVASYRYVETSFLPAWNGQRFPKRGLYARPFVLNGKLEQPPRIPKGRRVIVYDAELLPVWDSLTGAEFKPVRDGYILLI